MAVVNTSTPVDPVGPPPKDPETEQALEPSPSFSWYREVVEEHALVEQLCSEAQEEGLQADQCLPLPAGSVQVLDDSVEEVEQQSRHSEPGNNIQEILLEAQSNASYRETLDCISGCSSRPQGVSKRKLKLIGESLLSEWF